MARFGSMRASALPPEEILQSLLASYCIGISRDQAAEVCASADLLTGGDVKVIARRLERELLKHGFSLKHTHALDVVSQFDGRGSYLRALQGKAGAKPTYALFKSVEGETVDSGCYERIGDVIGDALGAAIELMPSGTEPSLCMLTKLPSGFNIDIRQTTSKWFNIFVACFRLDSIQSGAPIPVWLDEDELRAAFRRIVDGLERARPAVLVNSGAVPQTIEPWCKAWFRATSVQDGTPSADLDEARLFPFLDSIRSESIELEDDHVVIHSAQGDFRLECRWVNVIPAGTRKVHEVETAEAVYDVWRRYLRYRKAIAGALTDALSNITGKVDSPWFVPVNNDAICALTEQRKFELHQLALEAGVRYREVKTLDESGFAAPVLVMRLAAALGVEPEDLIDKKQSILSIPVTSIGAFVKLVAGSTHVIVSDDDSLTPDDNKKVALIMQRAGNLARQGSTVMNLDIHTAMDLSGFLPNYEKMIEDLLAEVARVGVLLAFTHEVRFELLKEATFQPVNVLHIHAKKPDERLRAQPKRAGF